MFHNLLVGLSCFRIFTPLAWAFHLVEAQIVVIVIDTIRSRHISIKSHRLLLLLTTDSRVMCRLFPRTSFTCTVFRGFRRRNRRVRPLLSGRSTLTASLIGLLVLIRISTSCTAIILLWSSYLWICRHRVIRWSLVDVAFFVTDHKVSIVNSWRCCCVSRLLMGILLVLTRHASLSVGLSHLLARTVYMEF